MHSKIIKSEILKFNFNFLLKACLIPFFILTYSLVFAQNENPEGFILSPRVGLELDSNEIEYFNIFPDIDDAKSAVYRLDNFQNLRMLISLTNGKDTTVSFSKLGAEELGRYIDRHEIIADSQSVINWELLPGYGTSKMNFFEDHGSILYVHCDSVVYSGKLLMIEDNYLILWLSTQPFRPDSWYEFSKKIPFEKITKIERKQDLTGKIFGITLGAGIGAALLNIGFAAFNSDNLSFENSLYLVVGGGALGAGLGWLYDNLTISRRKYTVNKDQGNYLNTKRKLEKRAIFSKIFPPELKNLKY